MNIIITKNLIKKLSIMEHILSSIGKEESLINGILVKSNGMLQAASRTLNMSFKLTTEELGLTPDLPANDFILPEMAYRFLKNLPAGSSADVDPVKDNLVQIVVDNGKKKKNKAEFATQPSSKYIAITKSDAATMQTLSAEWFKSAISKCSYAISDNNTKPIYTAAHLVARKGKIVAYAIDGFKAAVVSNSTDKSVKDFILSIPQEVIKILSGVEFADTVIVGFNESHSKAVFVTDEATVIQGSLYNGTPVMYDTFVNKGKFKFTLNTKDFTNTIRQICLFKTAKTSPMRMTVQKEELVCSFTNEKTRFEDTVNIENDIFEEDVVIGIDPDALLSTMKNCTEETTSFKFSGSLTPLEIYNGNLSAIVVPMKIKDNA